MKRIIFPLLLLFAFQNNYGQLSDSLRKYYILVNEAEINIVDAHYIEALNIYDNAFVYKANPFKKDIYNQAICAVLVNDYNKAYSNVKSLVDYGYEIDSLTNKREFESFFNSKFGKKLKQYKEKNIKLYNTDLRLRYDSLLRIDQYFRVKEGSYDVYGDTIEKIDNSNVLILNNLINKYGFPSEELVGAYPYFDYEPIKTIVIHNQAGSRGKRYDYTKILYDALYKGDLDVRSALQLIEGSTSNNYYGFFITGLIRVGMKANKGNPEKLSNWGFYDVKEKEQEYNKRREEIGLDTLADSRKKAIHSLKDKRFYLGSISSKKTEYWKEKKDYEYALKNLILIE